MISGTGEEKVVNIRGLVMFRTKAKVGMLAAACMIITELCMLSDREVWKEDVTCEKWEIADIRQPSFSVESGYYDEPFMLEIRAKLGGEIYYTLDGSEPNCSKNKYESPILIEDASKQPNMWSSYENLSNNGYYIPEDPVAKAVVVRAVEHYGDGSLSDINSAVYFVGEEIERYMSIPDLAIVTEPDNLFGYENGIMVLGKTYDEWVASLEDEELEQLPAEPDYQVSANFRNKGEEWEREVNLQYFEEGKLVWKQNVGIRNRGNAGSRGPTKCFNIYAREEYDESNRMLFSFDNGRIPDAVSLRNYATILHDGLLISLLADRQMAPFSYQPVNFFVDGEYWGLYNLTEKYNRQFFADYYNVKKDSVVIQKSGNFEAKTEEIEQSSSEEWDAIYDFIEDHDLALPQNYDVICNMIDVDSFIDYYCTQIYIDSRDCSEGYNVLQWKTAEIDKNNPYMDGKWRWVLYDIDFSLQEADKDNLNEEIREGRPAFGEHKLLKALLGNEEFEQRFINTMMDLINKNFRSDIVSGQLRELADEISVPMALHYKRFFGNDNYLNAFYDEVEAMDNFVRERPLYITDIFQKKFDLDEAVTIEISSENAGNSHIQLNSIEVDNNAGAWQGNYFEEIPISMAAVEADNRMFLKWEITIDGETTENTNQSIMIYPRAGMKIKALYQGK